MRWILITFLLLRTLMPFGITGWSVNPTPFGLSEACPTDTAFAAGELGCACCCNTSSCACEMSPAPAGPDRTPEPAAPTHSGSDRPILLATEPTTEMAIGWIDSAPAVVRPLEAAPVHIVLGESVQAAHCIWRT